MKPRVVVILPARYHSTRFPGKPLVVINGKPLIEWVHRRAVRIKGVDRVVVATDHEHIVDAVKAFGGEAVMTSIRHETGTDRVAEVAKKIDCDIIVNLQGDEPLFPASLVEEMIAVSAGAGRPDIVTAAHPVTDASEVENPHVIKVVMDLEGHALYFSRAPIPATHAAHVPDDTSATHYRHVGIYVFHKEALAWFASLERSPLEMSERLEQLRALENGMTIRVVKTEHTTVGVDVPGDIKNVEKALTI